MGSKLDSRKENNMEKGFDLKDGDVITEVVDEILSITFLDRVHQFIEWKIQLMDLENEFYLVRFDDIDDYNNVLIGGPWVVYGNYLTQCVEEEAFGLWMFVEKHRRRKGRSSGDAKSDDQGAIKEGLDFLLLTRKVNCDHAGVSSGKELLGKMVGKENSLFYFGAGFIARDMSKSSSTNSVELVE
ncbi:hypothetical protein Goklo_026574 [Gossypium klotzschianum]|uniref:DUF4283 domain-containing protein n=1 Tax=Gossypium klotzschianum TaxID=34286 RepID=A0A7J8TV98_9ROSI|nr:hypothetical protein [Gossypium klotzschianum]